MLSHAQGNILYTLSWDYMYVNVNIYIYICALIAQYNIRAWRFERGLNKRNRTGIETVLKLKRTLVYLPMILLSLVFY